jgi:hypothetical protein
MPHIPTLYQLSYQEFTLRYGLFREEIQDLIDDPDRRVPTTIKLTQGSLRRTWAFQRLLLFISTPENTH